VIGHAHSPDLVTWTVQPPLSTPGAGFGQLEVPQIDRIDGHPVLIFSCLGRDLAVRRSTAGEHGGVWAVPTQAETGPFEVGSARTITGEEFYSGRLARDREGNVVMLAFHNAAPDGFVGVIGDPIPVTWHPGQGPRLELYEPVRS
jgi:beta-fructofuranosidase